MRPNKLKRQVDLQSILQMPSLSCCLERQLIRLKLFQLIDAVLLKIILNEYKFE